MPPRKKSEPTRADRVIKFIETYCRVPEGALVGKPIKLADFQLRFIRAVYDNPHLTRHAILSMARKNAKTVTIACLLLAHTIGPERIRNSQVLSAANSRDQAALVFNLAVKILHLNPELEGLYRIVPSAKRIIGLKDNVEYRALSADATTAHGLSPVLLIIDECGQVVGPTSPFLEACLTASGAHENPLTIMISTQAASDADFLSVRIDDALRSGDPHTVCQLYAAEPNCDLLDEKQWLAANPALDLFRSRKDLEEQLKQAARIPALEASTRNLLLNQRVSLQQIWLAPGVWKSCSEPPDVAVFRSGARVALGLDLSSRNDLTAAVLSAKDVDGAVHLLPFVFAPQIGMKERELRDKAPYTTWVKSGQLVAVPGATLDYDWLFEWLRMKLTELEIEVASVHFDRWRIKEAQGAAARQHALESAQWIEVGQGYQSMSPRVEHFETLLLQGKLRHGAHPLLNMAAANAISVRDPAGNRKLDKSKATQRIDPLVAAVMSTGEFMVEAAEFDVSAMIG
jgi:phage terminase large subunit-like protein